MLILQRKKNQSIAIGQDIVLTIVDIGNEQVRIAIDAPRHIPIVRSELMEAAKANQEASQLSQQAVQSLAKAFQKPGGTPTEHD